MKVKTKLVAVLIFLATAACSLFAACKIGGKTWQEILGDAQYQDITYYAGGGSFDDGKGEKKIYYYAETPAMPELVDVTRTDYVFKGWYYAELDADGNPKFASEDDKAAGVPELSENAAIFPLTLKKDDHIYLGAKWVRDYKLKYFLYDSPEVTIGEKTYKNGDEIASGNFGTFNSLSLNYENELLKSANATLLEFYVKDDGGSYSVADKKVEKPATYDESVEDPHVAVYCKFISGVWEMVRDASDVRDMYQHLADGNSYYIVNDIDCSKNTTLTLKSGETDCKIQGNGHVISGQQFAVNNLANGGVCSVFGKIAKETVIENVIFDGFAATVSTIRTNANVRIYLFSHEAESGATLSNVEIKNSSLNIPKVPNSSTVTNIPKVDGSFVTDGWIFGAGDFAAVKYENLTLDIAGQTDVKNQENQQEA